MPILYAPVVQLGAANTGLTGTLGYRVTDATTSTVVVPFTTAGVTETTIAGDYTVSPAFALPPGFGGGPIVWGTYDGTTYYDLAEGFLPAAPPATPAVVPASTFAGSSSRVPVIYATDEDVYVEAGADWDVIVPQANEVAGGTDGVFLSTDPWTLASLSNNFAGQGVLPAMMVKITFPPSRGGNATHPRFFAVASVAGGSMSLRPAGANAGFGLAPAPAAGATGVAFTVRTLLPQLENSSYELNEQFSVDPGIYNREPGDIYDQRVMRRPTVLRTLFLLYHNANRSTAGDFAAKMEWYQAEYENELDRSRLKWGPRGNSLPEASKFSFKFSR